MSVQCILLTFMLVSAVQQNDSSHCYSMKTFVYKEIKSD